MMRQRKRKVKKKKVRMTRRSLRLKMWPQMKKMTVVRIRKRKQED
jgi:hypothetical protein